MLRGLRLRHESGELTADLLDAPNDFRFNLESGLDPTVLRAIASPGARPVSRRMGMAPAPIGSIHSSRREPRPGNVDRATARWHFSAHVFAALG